MTLKSGSPIRRIENCPKCDYSLNGLGDTGRCPECGLGFDKSGFMMEAKSFLDHFWAFALLNSVWGLLGLRYILKGDVTWGLTLVIGCVCMIASWPFRRRAGRGRLVVTPAGLLAVEFTGKICEIPLSKRSPLEYDWKSGAIRTRSKDGDPMTIAPYTFLGSARRSRLFVDAYNTWIAHGGHPPKNESIRATVSLTELLATHHKKDHPPDR